MLLEEDRRTQTFKLSGQALEAAKKYQDLLEESRKEYQETYDEAVMKLRNLQTRHMVNLKEAWMQIVEEILTEPNLEATWENDNYRLDLNYIKEHGSAYFNIYNIEISETQIKKPTNIYTPSQGSGGLVH